MTERTFTFRLTASGVEELTRQLRATGTAGEAMAQQLLNSSAQVGNSLQRTEAQIDRTRASLERTQAVAARGGLFGSNFSRNISQVGFQVQDFVTQVQGGQSAFLAFSQQGGQLAGVLAGGFAGLAVSLAALAAQFLFANRSTEAAAGTTRDYAEQQRNAATAIGGVNALLETQAERLRRVTIEQRQAAVGQIAAARIDLERRDAALAAEQAESNRIASRQFSSRTSPEQIAALQAAQAQNIAEVQAQRNVLAQQLQALSAAERRIFNAPVPSGVAEPSAASRGGGRGAAQNNAQILAELTRRNQEAERQAEALARANRSVDEVYEDQIDNINRLVPELERLFGVERANEIAARASVEAYTERARALERGTERASGAARELGFAFSSAFEDAIIKGERFSNVLRGLASDIARVILRRTVTDPLANAASGILGGINFGGLFSGIFGPSASTNVGGVPFSAVTNANGNVFAGGSLIPFARGGIVNGPTMFPMAGGRTGLMGEAGPEAIMPLARDGAGRLGVRGGAPSVTVVNNIDARGADPASEARIFAAIRASSEQTRASVFDAIRRGGSARAIVRGA